MRYDGELPIAVGRSRTAKEWKNRRMNWSQLTEKLREPVRTGESQAEYRKLSKAEQDRIKDVGGFVGGVLKGGRRKADAVEGRQLVTLDMDFAPAGLAESLDLYLDCAYAVYSTHKHQPDSPRLRLLIPLSRMVSPEEYEAISRKTAELIGIDYFDDTTYQPGRLMYWPSVSSDGEYLFDVSDAPWLNADKVLGQYLDWTDVSCWPESSRAGETRRKSAGRQGDPEEKDGLIGAFCRTYDVEEAIEAFLPDIYVKCDMPGRYTYAAGSTAAGLVIYDGGKFAYSNHGTDPAGGRLCNAFDLVRIHRFGQLDEDASPDTAATRLPSYKAMMDFVRKDTKTSLAAAREKRDQAAEDFGTEYEDDSWLGRLTRKDDGSIKSSLENLLLICQHDQGLKGIRFNRLADGLEIGGSVPWKHPSRFWRDTDDAQLESYLCMTYGEFPKAKIITALTKCSDDRSFHPVLEYLDSLPDWDGVPRLDTLLIDYLGAWDSPYVRAVTRKVLCAAIKRVQHPGCKFDTTLVLCGPQGVGKSTLIAKLGGAWYTDSLSLSDTRDKTAAEKLQGNWLVEISELAGLRKVEVESLKGFLSRQDDKYRVSYGRNVTPHPRQCIFIGTTNAEDGYLRDITGGRRFWPVNVVGDAKLRVWDMTQGTIDQIWAEALYRTEEGEPLILPEELTDEAEMARRRALEHDEREGFIREYLERLLPPDWADKSLYERREFLHGDEFGSRPQEGTEPRTSVCIAEIWCECLGKNKADLNRRESNAIAAIMACIPEWEKQESAQRVKGYGVQRVYQKR